MPPVKGIWIILADKTGKLKGQMADLPGQGGLVPRGLLAIYTSLYSLQKREDQHRIAEAERQH